MQVAEARAAAADLGGRRAAAALQRRVRRRPPPTTHLAEPRPVPLPLGPVERHGDLVGAAALAGFAGASAVTGHPAQRAGVALSTLPKAGRLGREGFATTFGRVLARRGAVVVEPSALRRMDRIDTVVLDAEALTTGVLMLGDLLALPGADGTADALDELVPRVHELFDPEDATAPRRLSADGEHWLLTGLDDIPGGDDPRARRGGRGPARRRRHPRPGPAPRRPAHRRRRRAARAGLRRRGARRRRAPRRAHPGARRQRGHRPRHRRPRGARGRGPAATPCARCRPPGRASSSSPATARPSPPPTSASASRAPTASPPGAPTCSSATTSAPPRCSSRASRSRAACPRAR